MSDTEVLARAKARPRVDGNESVSVWDLGEGVALFELTTALSDIDEAALDVLERLPAVVGGRFSALVIGNGGERGFGAGASLSDFLRYMDSADWAALSRFIRGGQDALLALRYSRFPVVAAVHGLAVGGGCELMVHCDAVVAHSGALVGFPEEWSGIVPGWGGCVQMLRRWQAKAGPDEGADMAFRLISSARIMDPPNAREALILLEGDAVVEADPISLGKAKALALAEGYSAPSGRGSLRPARRLPRGSKRGSRSGSQRGG